MPEYYRTASSGGWVKITQAMRMESALAALREKRPEATMDDLCKLTVEEFWEIVAE